MDACRRVIYASYIEAPNYPEADQWYWYRPLRRLGLEVRVFDYLCRDANELWEEIESWQPDLIWFVDYGLAFSEELLVRLREREGLTTICWASDDAYKWATTGRIRAPLFNLYVTLDMPTYRDALASDMDNVMLTQWGADCGTFYPIPDCPKERDVVFIGHDYADRRAMVGALQAAGIDAEFVCPSHGVPAAEQNRLLNGARIVLAPSMCGDGSRQIKARHFGSPAVGTMMLAERAPRLDEYFVPNEEMVCFDTYDEMINAAHHFLDDDAARDRIAGKGYRRVIRQHRMEWRLAEVIAASGSPVGRIRS